MELIHNQKMNADYRITNVIYFGIIIFSILPIIGILFTIFSYLISKRIILLIISLLGNGAVLVFAFMLLLAMGISKK